MTDIRPEQAPEKQTYQANSDVNKNPLLEEWLSLHANSKERNTKDNAACKDAREQDLHSVDARTKGTLSPTERAKDDKDDLASDFQAIGKHKGEKGDDQNNRDADTKLLGLDREILKKYGDQLSNEQKQAINSDIQAKLQTADNSNSDISQENKYIKGDKAEQAAIASKSPEQIDAANQNQIELRKQDAARETKYIADNNKSISADDKIMRLFGNIELK